MKTLRNPAEILIIQDELLEIQSLSIFAESIRQAAKINLNECIKMIVDQSKDNRPLVEHIVGAGLLSKIENFVR
jgi:hypothetical protein